MQFILFTNYRFFICMAATKLESKNYGGLPLMACLGEKLGKDRRRILEEYYYP